MKTLIATLALASIAAPVWAAPQTVTLSVPGMTCGACPITVRTALKRVPGVEKVNIDESQKLVAVTFDNTKATIQKLTKATEDAGYPSSVKP
ncbi:mercury resistance system periplasmic binding protein MerP [Thiobacillus sp.]|uniref:mercury resistance system periplasmic binding protein MerP n=1 Tax=Thiobacillus sp. TaxID=924 RepID=UPI0011DBCDA1|nr:mercury resistance system periplasmic binding protein MerP [Thiobacillus sp.]TXH74011.1 MAG: mercury resistance system periplasmic binding protein MerP [Thiobacillus sp.]